MRFTLARRGLWIVGAAIVAASLPAAAGAAFAPDSVIATSAIELQPAAALGYVAYSRSPLAHPGRVALIVKPDGSSSFRVNPRGTHSYAGSIDGTTLVYEQRRVPNGLYDIKLYDLVARTHSNPPAGVNTKRNEVLPHLSGDWLLFGRSRRLSLSSPRRILLRNLVTDEQRELDFGDNAYVQTGGLAGNYATWTRCPSAGHCKTWLYDIAAQTKVRLPNPLDRSQFAASVTADGTAYYAEAGTINCSRRKVVRFWRQPLAASRELLARLPRGKDTAQTSPVVQGSGAVDVFFDRFNGNNCARPDIYKIPVPAPGP
jgi:hypothetical protein